MNANSSRNIESCGKSDRLFPVRSYVTAALKSCSFIITIIILSLLLSNNYFEESNMRIHTTDLLNIEFYQLNDKIQVSHL